MAQKRMNPGGEAGVRCASDWRHSPDYKRPKDETQFVPGIDECVWRLGRALRMGRLSRDDWSFNFVRSVLRHSKRPGWVPTPKQLHAMRRLITELAAPDEALIDGGDDDRAA